MKRDMTQKVDPGNYRQVSETSCHCEQKNFSLTQDNSNKKTCDEFWDDLQNALHHFCYFLCLAKNGIMQNLFSKRDIKKQMLLSYGENCDGPLTDLRRTSIVEGFACLAFDF